MRRAVAQLVEKLEVRRFSIVAYGVEGGFSMCLEPAGETSQALIWQKIDAVAIHPKQTMFNAQAVETCPEPVPIR